MSWTGQDFTLLAGSNRKKSAFFPTSMEPTRRSMPSALAPSMVAILSIPPAVMANGSLWKVFCSRAPNFMASNMSLSLLEPAPSVPIATVIPAFSISPTGATPDARYILAMGL